MLSELLCSARNDIRKKPPQSRWLFQFQSVGRLAGHREGTVQHGTVIGMNADEIHAVVQALGVELHRVTINLLHHHALADSIVNLKANHALAFDVQQVGPSGSVRVR